MFVGLRDLRHAWGRFVLMGSVIALVAVLTRGSPGSSTLDAATIRSLGRQPGTRAEPLGLTFFNARDAAGTSLSIALVGIEPGGFVAKDLAEGSKLGRTPTGVIVSSGVAAEGVHVGDRVTLDRSSVAMRVVGVAPTATYGHVALVYAPIALWRQAAYGQVTGGVLPASARGLASAAALQVRPGVDVAAAGKRLGVDIVTKQQAYAGSPGYVAETATMSLIIDFLYVIAALIVGAFFTVWTIQRKANIGLLKALGASNGLVLRDALGQVALVMVGATAAGALVGSGIGSLIPGGSVPFALRAGAIVTAAVILAVAGLVGSLVAVRRIAAVDPIVALGAAS